MLTIPSRQWRQWLWELKCKAWWHKIQSWQMSTWSYKLTERWLQQEWGWLSALTRIESLKSNFCTSCHSCHCCYLLSWCCPCSEVAALLCFLETVFVKLLVNQMLFSFKNTHRDQKDSISDEEVSLVKWGWFLFDECWLASHFLGNLNDYLQFVKYVSSYREM